MDVSDTQERDKLRETDQLADTTFRNIEVFMDDMKSMVSAAKVYHKAMQSMAKASDDFFRLMESIGAKASNLPGSVRKLGDTMLEIVASHEHTRVNQEDWMQSLNTDFISPMEMKLRGEKQNLITEHKVYRVESGKRRVKLRRTRRKVKKIMKAKNPSRAKTEKSLQLRHMLTEHTEMMHTTCVEGLRTALIEERKLYCFCIDHFCSVLQNQISYHAASHCALSTQVNDWSTLCSSPHELPPESAALLIDPRSARAFPPSSFMADASREGPGSMLASALQLGGQSSKPQRRVSCRVKALFPHPNDEEGGHELEFNAGDLIDAIDDPQDGWQYGENTKTGNTGWFPVQYVNRVWPPPPQANSPVQPSLSSSLHLGTSATERDYLHGGSGSRRSSLSSSIATSYR